jgi:hypothetical protein
MGSRVHLSIWLSREVLDQVEARKGKSSRSQVIEQLVKRGMSGPVPSRKSARSEPNPSLKRADPSIIEHMKSEVEQLTSANTELRRLLSQAQAVSLSLTKQLPGEVGKAKHWWQFWKKG